MVYRTPPLELRGCADLKKENNTPEENEVKETETVENAAEKSVESEKKKKRQREKKPLNKRKLKHGALSAALTVTVIAAVVVLNVIVGMVSDRVNTSADLTTAGIYSLDEQTKKYLDNTLNRDVTITVLNSQKSFEAQDSSYKQVSEILGKMQMESSHIKVDYLNIDQNPNYTSKFKGETLSTNYIVVECEETGRHKIISPYDYFNFNQSYLQYYGTYVVESSNIEQETVSAMMYTTSEKLVRIAFTDGYGEEDSTAFQNVLSKNGYEVEKLKLNTTSEIDSDIDYVVIYAPTMDIDKEQLAKLDKFLDNNGNFGKNVVYFASTSQTKTPNIDEFLKDWGLEIGFEVVGQTDSNYLISSSTPYAHLQQVCDTDYTKNVYGSKLYTYGMYMRPVNLLDNGAADCDVLMKTFDKSFLYPLDKTEAEKFDINTAENGVFNDVVIAQKTAENGAKSRVCAAGSEMLVSTLAMAYSNSNNSDFFVGVFDSISGREQGVTIKSKSFGAATFEMSVKTANTLSIVLCVVIPVAVIVLGIVIWVRRRHR